MTSITRHQKTALEIMKLASDQSDMMIRAAEALEALIPLVQSEFGTTEFGRQALEKAGRSHAELREIHVRTEGAS